MKYQITLTLYINSKLDQFGNIKSTKLYLDEDCGSNYDAENSNELINCYSSVYKTIDKITTYSHI